MARKQTTSEEQIKHMTEYDRSASPQTSSIQQQLLRATLNGG
jgi:hypothetical protein